MAQIAYTENRPNCKLCHLPSFGAFVAKFSEEEELIFLCAECGFSRAWATWTGNYSKKLKALRLEAIFKFPADKAEPAPRPPLLEAQSVASTWNATFLFEGDRYTGALDPCEGATQTFATEWAALERARQISQRLAREVNKPNHWAIQTGITRNAD